MKMGESRGENMPVESGVGTLVWVRRRNGSWWPGRILAPEELPGSHLLSPRSGTPVKLLGREDASVDWYNIEKSKRVKAFRCGEFDDCIERAKSFAGLPAKKREKYARREDAILHALQLEKKQIELKQLCRVPGKRRSVDHINQNIDRGMEYDGSCRELLDGNILEVPNSATDATHLAVSVPGSSLENYIGSMLPPRKQKLNDSDWEDDTTEAAPRMRGLQDFGLRIAPLKRKKANWSNMLEDSLKDSVMEDDSKANSCITKNMGIGIISNCTKDSNFVLKRRRPELGPVPEESAYKRRDRRRPLIQVLESSAKLTNIGFQSVSEELLLGPIQVEDECLMPLHHQERQMVIKGEHFTESDGLESQSGQEGLMLQHACEDACGSKQDSFDSASILDKACSSFSNHLNSSCCNRRPLQFSSQLQAAPLMGAGVVDSLHRASPESTCSLLSVSANTGSATSVNDNGLDKSSSISMPSVENLPNSTSLQLLCNSSIKEAVCNRSVNGLVMARSTEGSQWVSSRLPPSMNSVPRRNNLPMFSYSEKKEDYRTAILKTGADTLWSPSVPLGRHYSVDLLKPKKSFPSHCPSSIIENLRSYAVEEDEAESFRIPSDLSVFPAIQTEGILKSSCLDQFEPVLDTVSPGCNEGRDETGFCNFINRGKPVCQSSCKVEDLSISKWQTKGKRNARVRANRSYEFSYGRSITSRLEELEQSQDESVKHIAWTSRPDKSGASLRANHACLVETEESRLLLSDKQDAAAMADLVDVFPHDKWEIETVSFPSVPKFHGNNRSGFDAEDIFNGRVVEPMSLQRSLSIAHLGEQAPNAVQQWTRWSEVQIVVQADCQREHVPLVSLMSKHNGKAIVGYPVIVESLESRYIVDHIGSNGMKTSSGCKVKKSTLHLMWKTARRTAMSRVPRSCSTSVTCHNWADGIRPSLKQTLPKLGFMGFFSHKRMPMTKSHAHIYSTSRKKYSKNLLKRSSLSSQKTRTLSSIAVDQSARHECTKLVSCPNLSESPLVTCIPVALVFSRIKEVLYGKSESVILDADRCLVDTVEKQEPS